MESVTRSTRILLLVTICAPGARMGLVEKVLYHNFQKWQQNPKNQMGNASVSEKMQNFLREKFQIKKKGENILDILNTMIAPSSDSSSASASAVFNAQRACSSEISRKKRSTEGLYQ